MSGSLSKFLEDAAVDHRGRTRREILSWDDEAWEDAHDYIQWLFPSTERSMAVPMSPVLREPEISHIRASAKAQVALDENLQRYKKFLHNSDHWRCEHDHNHLRITRVLKCLKALKSLEDAQAFKYWVAGELGDVIDRINPKTKQFWRLM